MKRRGVTRPWSGAKWIRPSTRWAIYLRDRLACVYCGASCALSLDHVVPHSAGGSHAACNLVTACVPCNSARKDRPMREWIAIVSSRTSESIDSIARRVRAARRRKLDRVGGRALALAAPAVDRAMLARDTTRTRV